MPETLTIDELLHEVGRLTADLPVADGRVARELTERNVRYYVTLGVVRPPVRQDNRSVWTHDHVLDLVRVRRAQALGMSLKLIGPPTEHPAQVSTESLTTRSWAVANSPALRAQRAGGAATADSGWSYRLSPNIFLSGFGPAPTADEMAALRRALPARLTPDPHQRSDTPSRKDGRQ